jgi:hypothetical protein
MPGSGTQTSDLCVIVFMPMPTKLTRVVFGFTIAGGKIIDIEMVADPERLRQLDLANLDD